MSLETLYIGGNNNHHPLLQTESVEADSSISEEKSLLCRIGHAVETFLLE